MSSHYIYYIVVLSSRYEDGARLLTHVDRESTHAVSMIVNVSSSFAWCV